MGALLVIAFIVLGVVLGPWLLMLAIGGVHSSLPSVPALGFWPCLLIMLICSLLFGGVSRSSS